MWSGIHSEPQTACFWRLSNIVGGGISSRIFSLPGNWFTTTDFLKLTQSALHQRTASIRGYTEPKKKKRLYLAPFGVCVDGHRGSLFSDKANFISFLCTGKTVDWRKNKLLCFIGRYNKANNKICTKNKDDIKACLDWYITYGFSLC